MKNFELEYKLVNKIKKSVDLGIDPIETIIESYQLIEDYIEDVNVTTHKDMINYVTNCLETWYRMKCTGDEK